MFILNGKPLAPDSPFTHNGVQYPANWLRLTSLKEKEAIGISEVVDPTPVDTRFYWDHNLPKDINDLKTQWKHQQDQTAYTLLSPTDWYVVRKFESGVEIPEEISTYRTAIRSVCEQRKVAIQAATDVPTLIEIVGFESLSWPLLNTNKE